MKRRSKNGAPSARMVKGVMVDDEGFEILGGAGGEPQIGEVIEGTFGGVVRTLKARKKGAPPIPFYAVGARELLGGAVLRARIEGGKVAVGDFLRVVRLEDAPKKPGQNAAKVYDVRVKRAQRRGRAN